MNDVDACLAAAIRTSRIALEVPSAFVTDELAMAAERLFDRAWSLNEADESAPALDPGTWMNHSNWKKRPSEARLGDS